MEPTSSIAHGVAYKVEHRLEMSMAAGAFHLRQRGVYETRGDSSSIRILDDLDPQ